MSGAPETERFSEVTTTATVAKFRKEDRSPERWNGELRKKREAQAEPTFFSCPAGQPSGRTREGSLRGSNVYGSTRTGSSEVARFRWDSG